MFKNLKLGTKLIAAFLIVGMIPFTVIGLTALNKSSNALEHSAFNELQAVRDIKKRQIENFFDERKGDMGVLVETVGAIRGEAFNKLIAVRDIKKMEIEEYLQNPIRAEAFQQAKIAKREVQLIGSLAI